MIGFRLPRDAIGPTFLEIGSRRVLANLLRQALAKRQRERELGGSSASQRAEDHVDMNPARADLGL
jgi:hypothetical protein